MTSATAAMPDTAPAWDAYRKSRQTGSGAITAQGCGRETQVRTYLTDWLVEFKGMPGSLDAARHSIRKAISALVVDLTRSFSPKQKTHLEERLRGLRDDFMALQSRPHMAGKVCN